MDGTLAQYQRGDIQKYGVTYIGPPIPKMLERVKKMLAAKVDVRIFTARVGIPAGLERKERDERMKEQPGIRRAITKWCKEHIGQVLEVTCTKDFSLIEVWDDRVVQVIPNTGERADGKE